MITHIKKPTYLTEGALFKAASATRVIDKDGDEWEKRGSNVWRNGDGNSLYGADLIRLFGLNIPTGEYDCGVAVTKKAVKLKEVETIDDNLAADIAKKQVVKWATLLERLAEDYGAEITRRGEVHYGLRLPNGDILWGSWEGYSFGAPSDRAVVIEAIKGRLKDLGGSADGEYSFVKREVKTIAGPITELDE